MLKMLMTFFSSKGTMIGFGAGILKIMQDVRTNRFKWAIALTDITASTIVGYSVYEWASESSSLERWQVLALTVMLSLNAFVAVKLLTEPAIVKRLFKTYFKIDLEEKEKDG